MALYFRSYGPPSTRKIWEEDEDEDENEFSPDKENELPSNTDHTGDRDPVI